ncbi:hypothetical protein LCGC14_2213040 [marine sediment metagenome]|uniref:Uncharacterized protein n=1 Tax=marine sediment metagenome TaxID=412755 RepID=A0A0F9DDC7_9ZZZZ
MSWKDKTCEYCKFRIDEECRKNPPFTTNNRWNPDYSHYPLVVFTVDYINHKPEKEYEEACSCYEEEKWKKN